LNRLIYGTVTVDVAADLGQWISTASTEFADEGRAIAVPVAGYIGGTAATLQLVVGAGIPLAIIDGDPQDRRDDAPNTLACLAWIRDEVEQLQQEQIDRAP
jgi:hypothetical protein